MGEQKDKRNKEIEKERKSERKRGDSRWNESERERIVKIKE